MRRIFPVPPPFAGSAGAAGLARKAEEAVEDIEDIDLDEAYAYPSSAAHTPYIRANFVASVDGAAEVGGRSGPLGGEADLRVFRLLRWLSDVVLVGAGTARTENYGPVVIPPERRERRVAAGLAAVPPIAVVTATAGFDPGARLFSGEIRPVLLTCETAPLDRRRRLAAVADIAICGGSAVEPDLAVRALAERGMTRILTEGGPLLHSQLAAAGLLYELCLTITPVLAGPGRLGIMKGEPWPAPAALTLTQILAEDDVLFLRYRR
ncbi:pyrimidine reductase family protein [Frankia sp. CcWB2]